MNKKSLFHISKRDTLPWYTNVAIRGGAIILALVVCALVTTILTGENPLSIYGTILKGAFGTARKSWTTWENVAILLGISLAVTPAFKMRFWNIGAEEMMRLTKDGKALYLHCLPADITGLSCAEGEVDNSVFDRYIVPLYKQASYKPYIIAAMIFMSQVKDPVRALMAMDEGDGKRKSF